MAEAVVTEQTCPSCSSVILVHKGYVAWCEHCDWNLQPQQPASPTTLFESLYLSVGKGANERLFTALQHAESLRPSLTPLKAAAVAVAAAIYGLALAVALCGIVANCVLHILARIVWIGAYALHHLLRRDSQRAEYLADHLASRVAGTAAMLSLLDKLHFGHKLEDAVQAVVFGKGNGDIADELQKQIADMPERELKRIRRVERLQTSRLDGSHPPTGYRIEFLRTSGRPAPAVTLDQEESEQMMRELAALWPTVQQALLAEWRWRNLYS